MAYYPKYTNRPDCLEPAIAPSDDQLSRWEISREKFEEYAEIFGFDLTIEHLDFQARFPKFPDLSPTEF